MKAPIALLLAAAVASGCAPKADASRITQIAGPPAVQVVSVRKGFFSTTVQLPGQLLPYESVDLYPKINGFILIRAFPVTMFLETIRSWTSFFGFIRVWFHLDFMLVTHMRMSVSIGKTTGNLEYSSPERFD